MKMKPWKALNPGDIHTLVHPPYLIFTDKVGSFISETIKQHTHGDYSHCCWFLGGDTAVSQGWIYREISIGATYLEGKHRVKVWKVLFNRDSSKWADAMIMAYIRRRLHRPWYTRLYDLRGIWGHFVGNKNINSSWRMYCSESVGKALEEITSFKMDGPTPADINRWCEEHPEDFTCVGVYDPFYLSHLDTIPPSAQPISVK